MSKRRLLNIIAIVLFFVWSLSIVASLLISVLKGEYVGVAAEISRFLMYLMLSYLVFYAAFDVRRNGVQKLVRDMKKSFLMLRRVALLTFLLLLVINGALFLLNIDIITYIFISACVVLFSIIWILGIVINQARQEWEA
jgi:hypothetical protein